ncbi:hypothetical protein [Marinospirillum insulare]|uniref:Uncharacterized protein n=1 Tax=Marinospirillum insulare TaxID=217169 RepID=A0ABQ5ZY92_9GAMM|nr:hypothetical protein [Marinospirillum insulare]GLR62900.1 hypothetical protein GCM10007878_03350 [Marinospirillum insulare]
MDNLIVLSWLAYFISCAFLLLASWKLMFWLPFTLKVGVVLSQLAILLVPTAINETAKAPAFIVLVIDLLSRLPLSEALTKAAPLIAALVLVWPIALLWGWLRGRYLNSRVEAAEAENSDTETN